MAVQNVVLFQDNPLQLTLGGQLSPINVAYQTYGTLNADKSNAVLVGGKILWGMVSHLIHLNIFSFVQMY